MAALPTTTVAFASGATEAEFKTFLSDQRAYLAGLLGTDGTAATAKSTLGVNNGVTSINGNSGAITASQIAAAATDGYGYTPANTSHTHSNYVSTNMTHGAVGSLCLCSAYNTTVAAGGSIAGSSLNPAGWVHSGESSSNPSTGYGLIGPALSGTWRCLGINGANSATKLCITLWQRIS